MYASKTNLLHSNQLSACISYFTIQNKCQVVSLSCTFSKAFYSELPDCLKTTTKRVLIHLRMFKQLLLNEHPKFSAALNSVHHDLRSVTI